MRFRPAMLNRGATVSVETLDGYWTALGGDVPELIVLDLALFGPDWKEAVAQTRQRVPVSKILVTAALFSDADEISLLRLGIAGCCGENVPPEMLRRIVDMILDGGVWISNTVLPVLLRQLQVRGVVAVQQKVEKPDPVPAAAKLSQLTPREREIAGLVGRGASNKVIARELNITDRTVKAHLGAIFQKLGTPDRLRLAVYLNDATGKAAG
ncbi:MAG: DNA-binding response regulator [Herminiimonas sp.]|nr:DNA-binding response regulator [Herminiimonas sp.]